MALDPEALLVRSPSLSLRVDSSNIVYIDHEGTRVECGARGLAILDAFYRPITLRDALRSLEHLTDSAEGWMELTRTVVGLVNAGIVRPIDDRSETQLDVSGYGALAIHSQMLNDTLRTETFLEALAEVVEPGDVVVDIGTGTGVLAVGAAKSGAERVYAIEASSAAGLAQQIFETNQVGDRVEIVRGWSTEVELPQRADVLVSEMIGDDPLTERILEITLDARKRLLKDPARLIPRRLRLLATLANVPDPDVRKMTVSSSSIAEWDRLYGMDFSPLLEARGDAPQKSLVRAQRCSRWAVGGSEVLVDIDLTSYKELFVDASATLSVTEPTEVNAVIVQFDCELSENVQLSTVAGEADEDNHWHSPVWVLPRPLKLEAGGAVEVSYSYRVPQQPDGVRIQPVSA